MICGNQSSRARQNYQVGLLSTPARAGVSTPPIFRVPPGLTFPVFSLDTWVDLVRICRQQRKLKLTTICTTRAANCDE
eukprot:SAG31_NODE_4898_length_2878_cov_2.329975_5_plen_78_part_00